MPIVDDKNFFQGTEIPEFPEPIPSINPFPIPITDSDGTSYSRNRFFGKFPVPPNPRKYGIIQKKERQDTVILIIAIAIYRP